MAEKKKEHTTFEVGPISESRMRDIMEGLWQEGGYGRKALREELKGPMWFATQVGNLNYSRGYKPPHYIFNDCVDTLYGLNWDTIIISQWIDPNSIVYAPETNYAVAEFSKEGEVLWKALPRPDWVYAKSLDLNRETGRLLCAAQKGDGSWHVLELEKGVIIRDLTVAGNMGLSSQSLNYSYEYPNTFYIAEPDLNRVSRMRWDGTIEWSIAGLNRPTSIQVGGLERDITIADRNNHRIIRVRLSDNAVLRQVPHPYPSFKILPGVWYALFYGDTWANGGSVTPTFIMTTLAFQSPMWMLPPGNSVTGRWDSPFIILMQMWGNQIHELDLGLLKGITYPWSLTLFAAVSAGVGVPVYSPPIPDYFNPLKTITLKATQAGTVVVEIAKFVSTSYPYGGWDGTWETYLTEALVANVAKHIPIFAPLGVCRVSVTLGVAGTVDGWVSLSG